MRSQYSNTFLPFRVLRDFRGSVFLLFLLPAFSWAADKPPAKLTYDDHLLPLLREKCFGCHNPDKTSGGLNLTSYSSLMQGGSSGEVIAPGDPDNSYLYMLVTHQSEPTMPPSSEKLADAQLTLIKDWIAGGALQNAGSKPAAANKPKIDLALSSAPIGKPDGPPPMPGKLPLETLVHSKRASAVTAMAASPWAPLVAVGGQKQVLLYHSETLELLGVLPFEEGVATVLKFSRNGKLLLAGGGRGAKLGRVAVWNIATGERLFTVGEEFDAVLAADINAEQTRIALGGPSKVVRIYSTADGQLVGEIKKHTDWITSLEFSPDGVLLATGDRNGGLFVWEGHTLREYLMLRGHTASITDVTWRGDSNVLASGSEDGSVRLWEMENGNQLKTWNAHAGGVQSLHFAHDGRLATCGRDRATKLWDQQGKQQKAFPAFGDIALQVAVHHDQSRVIAGDWTGEIRVWSAADSKELGRLSPNPPPLADRLAEARKELAAAQQALNDANREVAKAQAASDKLAASLRSAEQAVAEAKTAAAESQKTLAAAQAAIDKAKAGHAAAEKETVKRREAIKLISEAANKAHEASAALADNLRLAQIVANLNAELDRAAADLVAGIKSAADAQAASKPLEAPLVAAKQKFDQAAAAVAAAQKLADALTAQAKTAAEKLTAAKAAAEKATAKHSAANARVERMSEALAQAQPAASTIARGEAAKPDSFKR
jgi:hypothetical protein